MSLKTLIQIWMLGGSIEIHPCSHVGQMFQGKFSIPKEETIFIIARSWMDDFAEPVIQRNPSKRLSKENRLLVKHVKFMRKQKQSKPFLWYRNKVLKSLEFLPYEDVRFAGQIRGEMTDLCLTVHNKTLVIDKCQARARNQFFQYSKNRQLMYDYDVISPLCLQPIKNDAVPRLVACDENNESQKWKTRGQSHSYLLSEFENLCLELDTKQKLLTQKTCVKMAQKQMFVFE